MNTIKGKEGSVDKKVLSLKVDNIKVPVGTPNKKKSTGSKKAASSEKFGLKVVKSFDDFELKESLLRGVYAHGWERPSDIQARAILPMLEGKDLIGQAQSGKGKTGAFTIAGLDIIDAKLRSPQVLILGPTRELANQTYDVAGGLASYMEKDGLERWCLVGGTCVRDDVRALRRGPQFLVGTPGRTLAHLERGALKLNNLKMIVLDEADEMLSRGFKDSMYDIFSFVPQDVQVCVFSATMKDDTVTICEKFMRKNRVHILLKAEEVTLDGIAQYFIDVEHDKFKVEVLTDLYSSVNLECVVIFCNRRDRVTKLAEELGREDFTCSTIHGGMTAEERRLRMKEFRSGASRVLIATDLLARGIDVSNVSLVINYDLPSDYENYIHRIGRSGRYGKKGVAINFVRGQHRDDIFNFNGLKDHYKTKIPELPSDLAEIF